MDKYPLLGPEGENAPVSPTEGGTGLIGSGLDSSKYLKSDGNQGWVLGTPSGSGGAGVFLPASYADVGSLNHGPQDLVVSPDGLYAYCAGRASDHGRVAKVNLLDGSFTEINLMDISPCSLSLNSDGSHLYLFDSSYASSFIDILTSSMTLISNISLEVSPSINAGYGNSTDISPDDSTIAYVSGNDLNVYLINTADYSVSTISVGNSAGGANTFSVCFLQNSGEDSQLAVSYSGVSIVDTYIWNTPDAGVLVTATGTGAVTPCYFTMMRTGYNDTLYISDVQNNSLIVCNESVTNISLPGGAYPIYISVNKATPEAIVVGVDTCVISTNQYEAYFINSKTLVPVQLPNVIGGEVGYPYGIAGISLVQDDSNRIWLLDIAPLNSHLWSIDCDIPLEVIPNSSIKANGMYELVFNDSAYQSFDITGGDALVELPNPLENLGKIWNISISKALDAYGQAYSVPVQDHDSSCITADGLFAFIAGWTDNDYALGKVAKVNLLTGQTVSTLVLPSGTDPHGIACTDDGRFLAVADVEVNHVFIIDSSYNLNLLYDVDVSGSITDGYDMCLDPAGTFAYLTDREGTVIQISVSSGTITNTYSELEMANIASTDDSNFIIGWSSTTLTMLDVNANTRTSGTDSYGDVLIGLRTPGYYVIYDSDATTTYWINQADLTVENFGVSNIDNSNYGGHSVNSNSLFSLIGNNGFIQSNSGSDPLYQYFMVENVYTGGAFYTPDNGVFSYFAVDNDASTTVLRQHLPNSSTLNYLQILAPVGSSFIGQGSSITLNQTGSNVTLLAETDGYRVINKYDGPLKSLSYSVYINSEQTVAVSLPDPGDYSLGFLLTYINNSFSGTVLLEGSYESLEYPVITVPLGAITFIKDFGEGPAWFIQSIEPGITDLSTAVGTTSVPNGGTGLTASGEDPTQFLRSDGADGFTMSGVDVSVLTGVLAVSKGGTGITDSGTDASLALMSDGADGFVMSSPPASLGSATGLLGVVNGGTGLTASGTDGTKALMSDGSNGFAMGSVANIDGNLYVKVSHLGGFGGTPTVVLGAGAGTNATYSIQGTDLAGTLTILTDIRDTPAANDVIAIVTFAAPFITGGPRMFISYANANSAALGSNSIFCDQTGVSTTDFTLYSGSVPLTNISTKYYLINYMAVEL